MRNIGLTEDARGASSKTIISQLPVLRLQRVPYMLVGVGVVAEEVEIAFFRLLRHLDDVFLLVHGQFLAP